MNLRLPVLKTLAFFEIFNQPLTLLELERFLNTLEKIRVNDLRFGIEHLVEIDFARGFFFLRDNFSRDISSRVRASLVDKRICRNIWQERKMLIARRAARLLSWIPFTRLVAICNTLGFGVAEETSDIDFFVIVKKGRVWSSRFFCVLTLTLFGLYRRGKRIKDKICLSFFVDEENLNLERVALDKEQDIYLIYWAANLVPLIDREDTLLKFWRANDWIKKNLANFDFENWQLDSRKIKENLAASWLLRILEFFGGGILGNWMEKILKAIQLLKMRGNNINQQIENGSAVIVRDTMLKFHKADRREEYRRCWLARLKEFGI